MTEGTVSRGWLAFLLLVVAGLAVSCAVEGNRGGGDGHRLPEEPYQIGVDHLLNGELEAAIDQFSLAISLDPNYEPALEERGRTLAALGEWRRAIEDFSRLIELGLTSARVHNERGLAYQAAGDKDKALSDFAKAIEIAPNFMEPYVNRARLLLEEEKFDLAAAELERALEVATEAADKDEIQALLSTLATGVEAQE